MTDNIFDFPQTKQALGNLSETIIRLDTALKTKKQAAAAEWLQMSEQISQKESRLEGLRYASSEVIGRIDALIATLDNVLEQNGSGNNHN